MIAFDSLHQQTAHAILREREQLVKNAIDRQYASQPDEWQRYQEAGYQKSLRDSHFHFTYLAEALAHANLPVFLDYVGWLKIFFASKAFPPATLSETLRHMLPALHDRLPAEQAALAGSYLEQALAHVPALPDSIPSFLSPENPYFDLANDYLNCMLKGDRRSGSQLILAAVQDGAPVREIYLHVFQNTQRELGRLWHLGRISVAQEHFTTAATQMVISQLYPYIFTGERNGRSLVATCVGEELHELGIRTVADFFEMDGWDTYFLGANTPAESVIRSLSERQAVLAAISVTLPAHISKATALIQSIRSALPQVKLLVGGYPFNVSPDLWQAVGADGSAPDAEKAVQVGNLLVGEAG